MVFWEFVRNIGFRKHIRSDPRNAQFTSPTTQNQIIAISYNIS